MLHINLSDLLGRIQCRFFYLSLFLGADQAQEQHLIIYNPLAWNVTAIVNITVMLPSAAVHDDDGQPVPAQVCQCLLLLDFISLSIVL